MRTPGDLHSLLIEMTKYLDILFHHVFGFAFILLVLPLGLSAALVALYPTAEAGASIWVNDPNYLGVAAAQTSDWNQYLTPAQNESDILGQMLQTETFQKQVTAQLDSSSVWRSTRERSDTAGSYTNNLKINVDGSHLLNLTFICPRANLCVQVLQATIDVYKRALDQQQQQQAKAASSFYAGQLKQARAVFGQYVDTSPDGIHWARAPRRILPALGDYMMVTRDHRNRRWWLNERAAGKGGRNAALRTGKDLWHWSDPEIVFDNGPEGENGRLFATRHQVIGKLAVAAIPLHIG